MTYEFRSDLFSLYELATAYWIHTFQAKRPQWTNYSVIPNRKYSIFFSRLLQVKIHIKSTREIVLCDSGYLLLSQPLIIINQNPPVHSRHASVHTQTLLSSSSSVLRSTFYSSIAYIVFWGWKNVVPVASRHKVFFIVIYTAKSVYMRMCTRRYMVDLWTWAKHGNVLCIFFWKDFIYGNI